MPAQSAIVVIVGGVAQRALQPFVISKMPLVIGKIKFVSTFIILKIGEKIGINWISWRYNLSK